MVIKPQGAPARGGRGQGPSEPPRRKNRTLIVAGVTVGVVVVAGAGYFAFKVLHGTSGQSAAAISTTLPTATQNATTPAATPSATATATTTTGTTAVTYVLSAPSKAGGYTRTPSVSATVQEIGTGGATQLMTAVEAGGGKATSNVSAEYLIVSDQDLGYAGFNGSFSPQAVMKDFQAGATGVTSEPAGPHGGQLACGQVMASSPTSTSGEACVWATTSTIGMVEFYGDNGGALEAVSATKAGADALKFRDDVEAAKQ
ncbi:MAG TPA: hypothetical protein VMU95_01485 [Trebonia sp.]|nr:hypothetical protein [Trebonia sp.]